MFPVFPVFPSKKRFQGNFLIKATLCSPCSPPPKLPQKIPLPLNKTARWCYYHSQSVFPVFSSSETPSKNSSTLKHNSKVVLLS